MSWGNREAPLDSPTLLYRSSSFVHFNKIQDFHNLFQYHFHQMIALQQHYCRVSDVLSKLHLFLEKLFSYLFRDQHIWKFITTNRP